MKTIKLLHVVILTLLLTACSQTFFVNVEGDLNSGVRFCFYGNLSDKKPKEHELREFNIQKQIGDDWKDVWTIEGPFEVACIDYGAESADYKTLVQPLALERRMKYRVAATDTESPIGYAGLTFRIDETGKPVVDD